MTGPKTNEREGTRAVLRNTRTSAYKIREVLDLVRGLPIGEASDILRFSERDAAGLVLKLLNSAVANAETNDGMVADELYISACFADEGRTYKTFRPRARGRAGRLRKRTAHVTIIVGRLPEHRLGVVKAKQERAEADRRTRRVAASQKQGGRTRRTRRRGGAEETPAEGEGPSGPTEREAEGQSGPTEREAEGPSGPTAREAEGTTGAEREMQAIVDHEDAMAAAEAAAEPDEQDEAEADDATEVSAVGAAGTDEPAGSGGTAEATDEAGVVDQQKAGVEPAKQADQAEDEEK